MKVFSVTGLDKGPLDGFLLLLPYFMTYYFYAPIFWLGGYRGRCSWLYNARQLLYKQVFVRCVH